MNKLTLASLPEYTMTLPVSGMVIKYRPFVVKEEKVLLMALQSNNQNQINDAIRNVVSACTKGTLDTKKICTADTEYAFLQIRCKSVGEEVKPQVVCGKCEQSASYKLKLDEITITAVDKEAVNSEISLNDTTTVIMRYPSMHDLDYNLSEVEMVIEMSKKCIDSFVIGEEVVMSKDLNAKDISDFVENLLPEQFEKIMKYFKSIPELRYSFKFVCPHCSESNAIELKSVTDFFQ
jgi:hypothetical protein